MTAIMMMINVGIWILLVLRLNVKPYLYDDFTLTIICCRSEIKL